MIAEHWVNISQVIMLTMSNDKRKLSPKAYGILFLLLAPKF